MADDAKSANLKRVTWQSENCLGCNWFRPADPVNADMTSIGKCVHPALSPYELVVTGHDWCNAYEEISQETMDSLKKQAREGAK